MNRVLLVDDEINVPKALRRVLMSSAMPPLLPDMQVDMLDDPGVALTWLETNSADLVVSDYRMPGMDGVSFLREVKQLQPDAACVLMSANADLDALTRAVNEVGIQRFFVKPWIDQQLKAMVADILELRALQLENAQLADAVRMQRGVIDRQVAELRRLERETPGITRVRWSDDGAVLLED